MQTAIEDLRTVRLNIQLTKRCNQRCKSCNSYLLDTTDELNTSTILYGIEQACDLFDIKNIAFTGGEPTIHKDILKIAEVAKRRSPNVSVTTNGYYFTTKERTEELVFAGINRFSFSYHGVGIHDAFTGVKGSEQRIRQAIKWICELREKYNGLYIKIGILFDGKNISNIDKLLDYASKLDRGGCRIVYRTSRYYASGI